MFFLKPFIKGENDTGMDFKYITNPLTPSNAGSEK
jgi:hypothetical protein